MKTAHGLSLALILLCPAAWGQAAAPGPSTTPQSSPGNTIRQTGIQTANSISTITGMAISPLLGVGAVGAYQWWHTPEDSRDTLHWFAQPWFWIPALLLALTVAAKDILGTAAPTVLKKPFDVAEALENKVSALVVAGAVIPLVITVFPESTPTAATFAGTGLAAVSAGDIGNTLLIPFAILGFAIVWLASHAINMLILLSPFSTVDAALKALRLAVLSLVTGAALTHPYAGAAVSLVVFLVAILIAGWSFRLLVCGNVFLWDLLSGRHRTFKPDPQENSVFVARPLNNIPTRTYGRLKQQPDGSLLFAYRPWLVLPQRQLELPRGSYVVGRGLLYPEIARVEDSKLLSTLLLPPRFRTHEQEVSQTYHLAGVQDVGVRKWLGALREMLGFGSRVFPASTNP